MPNFDPRIAVDLNWKNRPGVPLEWKPHKFEGAHWPVARQTSPGIKVLVPGQKEMPPVFGTAQPPSGLSGLIRAFAFRYPDHYAKHWLALLLADRVNVLETQLRKALPLALIFGGGLIASRMLRARRA